jgi:hypothetical protein
MASFTARLVRRYGPGGSFWAANPEVPQLPIRAWQVWNEPNLPRYWAGKPNAKEYVKLLRATSRAIKRVDPEAEVVTAGMPDSTLRRVVPLYTYIHEMYLAGASEWFDTMAINAYAEHTPRLLRNLRKVRMLMTMHRDAAGIWITELGWGTGGPTYRFRTTKQGQAHHLRQSFGALERERKRLGIRGVVHYMWQDAPPFMDNPDFWGLHTGLLDIDGREKPAFAVFRSLGRKLRWLRDAL